MELLIGLFIWGSIGYFIYLKIKEGSEYTTKKIKNTDRLKTSKSRLKRMIKEEDDHRSIEEIQKSLDVLTVQLEKNIKLLEEIEEKENDEKTTSSPYSVCNDAMDYRYKNLPVTLTYKDSSGNVSNRNVDLSSFDGYYLGGYCHLKKSYRTFVINRVLSFADGETGEVISDPCIFLKNKYLDSPAFIIDNIFDRYREVLRVLLYVVKVDGRYTKHEKVLVRKLVRSLNSSNTNLDDKIIDDLMNDIEIPSIHSFRIAVGKVLKMNTLPFDIINEIENIIQADGKIHDLELETINYIKKRLKKI